MIAEVRGKLLLIVAGSLAAWPATAIDADGNGLGDVYEAVFTIPAGADLESDWDMDGWTLREENLLGTDPRAFSGGMGLELKADAATDALSVVMKMGLGKSFRLELSDDLEEWTIVPGLYSSQTGFAEQVYRLSEAGLGQAHHFRYRYVGDIDTDADQLTDWEESHVGSDPLAYSTGGSGLPDGWLFAHGYAPRAVDTAGASDDGDGDGMSLFAEFRAGKDPGENDATGSTRYAVIDLGPGAARKVNVRMEVLIERTEGVFVLWSFAGEQSLGGMHAEDLNDQGTVVGWRNEPPDIHGREVRRALKWKAGTFRAISPAGLDYTAYELGEPPESGVAGIREGFDTMHYEARGLNIDEDVVGYATTHYWPPVEMEGIAMFKQAAELENVIVAGVAEATLWREGAPVFLGGFLFEPDELTLAMGIAINRSGDIAGHGLIDPGGEDASANDIEPFHAFSSRGEAFAGGARLVDLGTLGGWSSYVSDIDAKGRIVGHSTLHKSDPWWRTHAFLWDRVGGLRDLGTLGEVDANFPEGYSHATAINVHGQIVGRSLQPAGDLFFEPQILPVLWQNGQILPFTDLVPPLETGWLMTEANDLNDGGVVVGEAYHLETETTNAVLLLPVEIAVDANRDGVIKIGSSSETTKQDKPFRFWINDDDDGDSGAGEENVESTRSDSADGVIKSTRDLEDFSRLHVHIGAFHDAIKAGTFQVGLEWRNVTGIPSIKVYQAAETDGDDQYLRTEIWAGNQVLGDVGTSLGTISPGGSFKFPTSFWQADLLFGRPAFSADDPDRFLIFEGASEGKGQLVLTFWKDGQKIGEGAEVWLDLVNVRKMYERAKATGNIAAPHDSTTTPPAPTVGYVLDPYGNQWEYPTVSWTASQDYVVFVHGWNTEYNSARIFFAETMFKRLWQRGYKGRFAALYWPTLVGPGTYNESEYRAWFYGESLKEYLASLPGDKKHLVAHSMGNIVAGSALRKGSDVKNYALLNAAVPASCYDPNPSLQQSYGLSPDNDTDAPTQALAYKNKISSAGNTKLINFYLATDDALQLWSANNTYFKPETLSTSSFGDHAYKYFPGNPSAEKLFLTFYLSATRNLTSMEESLAYAAKSSTHAVGAEGNTRGSVQAWIDESGYGYQNEHSGFWRFTLQKMKPAYDRLMDEMAIRHNE